MTQTNLGHKGAYGAHPRVTSPLTTPPFDQSGFDVSVRRRRVNGRKRRAKRNKKDQFSVKIRFHPPLKRWLLTRNRTEHKRHTFTFPTSPILRQYHVCRNRRPDLLKNALLLELARLLAFI
ncbi:hypothetical protein SRHO_G00193850 [Serrasalmus rhombeus]